VVIIAKGGVGRQHADRLHPQAGVRGTPSSTGSCSRSRCSSVFEAAASIAEETENPRRSIPIAVVGAVALSAVL